MFRLDNELKVYLHRDAVDFRKSINGLAAIVEQSMKLDPFAQAVYVFSNQRRDRIKILLWDRNGFWLAMPPPCSSPTDELQALRAELAAMKSELRVVTVERDLLREKLKAYQRQLFAAKSEVRGAEQRDLFLNEAEVAATGSEPAQETEAEKSIEVGAHERKKRGRKPLDPMLPRELVRHELPESERVCAHDGHALAEIGAEISEQLDIVPQQVRVIQHPRVKYACPCCDLGIKATAAPARIIPTTVPGDSPSANRLRSMRGLMRRIGRGLRNAAGFATSAMSALEGAA